MPRRSVNDPNTLRAWARNDVTSVNIPENFGGCGQAHTRPTTKEGWAEDWAVDCPACAPILIRDHGFGNREGGQELTHDETLEAEKADQEASKLVREVAKAQAEATAEAIAKTKAKAKE